jgi:hypothetical protein
VNKTGFSHAAAGFYPAGYANLQVRGQIFGRGVAELGKDIRDGMGEVESPSVRFEPKVADLLNALLPLAQQIVF